MSSNRLPKTLEELISLAEDTADGAHELAATVGLVQNTESVIRLALADLVMAKNAYDTAVSDHTQLALAVDVANNQGRTFLTVTRDVFKTFLGGKPSDAWEAPGWSRQSIAIPSESELVLPLLQSVNLYLVNHPERENSALEVTAVKAAALHTALSTSRSALNRHDDLVVESKETRDKRAQKLRTRLRGLIDELGQLLDPMSPHWITFGLNRPGQPSSPGAVKNTRATSLGGGKIRVQCDPAARANYYQIYLQIVGSNTNFSLVDSPQEPDKILEGLTAGATVMVRMRALNDGGEGPFGETVTVTVV